MKLRAMILLVAVIIAGCQTGGDETVEVPTAMVLPSITPTATITATPTVTDTPTITATPSHTPTLTHTPTATHTPTLTYTPTDTPTATVTINPTFVVAASATAAVQEAPTFVTLTPLPPDVPTPTGTPQVLADVVITEAQFQEEVNLAIEQMPSVSRAVVNFTPENIVITVTTIGGDGAFVTLDVLVHPTVFGGFVQFQGGLFLAEDDPEPSDEVVLFVNDFFEEMIVVLDGILHQRLGPDQDLENLVLTNDVIAITLLVPEQ